MSSVLIVDDDPDNFDVIEVLLFKEGYDLSYACSGNDALSLLEKTQPDVILLDVMMPDVDGIEVCKQIKANPSWHHIPIIMVTALNSKEDLARCLDAGADDFLSKPLSGIELRARIGSMLRIKKQYDALQTALKAKEEAEDQLKLSLQEKEWLLKEIHHRVKNNLNIVSSLLRLQSASVTDKLVQGMFSESQNRVKAMALIHEKLYQSLDLKRINASEYIPKLASTLFESYKVSSSTINLKLEVANIWMDTDTAIPCGLIINELVTNSLKYAFKQQKEGEVCIRFNLDENQNFNLIVGDSGVGLPPDFDIELAESLGLQLVNNLTEQLGGSLEVDSRTQGTSFKIIFARKIDGSAKNAVSN